MATLLTTLLIIVYLLKGYHILTMPVINWVIGQNKTSLFFSYILTKVLPDIYKYYEKYPELHPSSRINLDNLNLFKEKINIIPQGYNINTEKICKYNILSSDKLYHSTKSDNSQKSNDFSRKKSIYYWEPYTYKYFTCDEQGLVKLVNLLEKNSTSKISEKNHIIPYPSIVNFINWYISERINEILPHLLTDVSLNKSNNNEISNKDYKIFQNVWFVGNEIEFTDIFENKLSIFKSPYVNIILVIDNIDSLKYLEKTYDKKVANFLKENYIYKFNLLKDFSPIYKLWLEHLDSTWIYITQQNTINSGHKVKDLRNFLLYKKMIHYFFRYIKEIKFL